MGTLSLVIIISSIILYISLSKSLIKGIDSSLETAARKGHNDISAGMERSGIERPDSGAVEGIEELDDEKNVLSLMYSQLLELSGEGAQQNMKIIAKSKNLKGVVLPLPRSGYGQEGKITFKNFTDNRLSDSPLRLVSFPFKVSSNRSYILQFAAALTGVKRTLNNVLIILMFLNPLLIVILCFAGYFLVNKSLSPVREIVASAKKITAADLSHRIESISAMDEIAELVDTFNDMISRLDISFKQAKQFTSDVSHELKTPLTVIRSQIEVALRKKRDKQEYIDALGSALIEVKELQKIIDNLLFLSKTASKSAAIPFKTVAIDKIVHEVFEYVHVLAEEKKIGFVLKEVQEAQVQGDGTLLKRVFFNLFENTIKYSGPGSKTEIFLEKEGGFAKISIIDRGVGINGENLPYIFDTFFRVDKSRSRKTGSIGLGLSIVKRIVELHQGRIEVESAPGEGSTFTVLLPVKN